MKEYKSYSQKLQDPRWQEVRLRVMDRDGFKCKRCGDNKNMLQVHHKKYFKGRDPWNYDFIYLETLCNKCHYGEHNPKQFAPPKEWEGIHDRPGITSRQKKIERLQKLLKEPVGDILMIEILTKIKTLTQLEKAPYG